MPMPEPRRTKFPACPIPASNPALFGHEEAERAFLDGWRAGRLHHAWLIGGPEGIGKATLAYRVARFLLASGDDRATEDARARDPGRPSRLPAGGGAIASRPRGRAARPAPDGKGYSAEDLGRRRAPRPRPVRVRRRRRGLPDLHRRQRRRPQPEQRQRAPQGRRGAAGALAVPHRQPRAPARPADHPLPLPATALAPARRGEPAGGAALPRLALDGARRRADRPRGGARRGLRAPRHPHARRGCDGRHRRGLGAARRRCRGSTASVSSPSPKACPAAAPRTLSSSRSTRWCGGRPSNSRQGRRPARRALRLLWRYVRRSRARRARSTPTTSTGGPSSCRCSRILAEAVRGTAEPQQPFA